MNVSIKHFLFLVPRKRRSATANGLEEAIIIVIFLVVCVFLFRCCNKKRPTAEHRRNNERIQNTYNFTTQAHISGGSRIREEYLSSYRHSVARVHGRQNNMFISPTPPNDSVIIDLPTTNSLGVLFQDLPPSYEPCPSYQESIKNIEHWDKLEGKY